MPSMFDVSASELLVIGAVALIVIGPKELPGVLRMVGQTVGKLKRMAGDFRTQFDDAMREADLHEIKKTVSDTVNTASAATSFNPLNTIRNEIKSTVDDLKGATKSAEDQIAKPVEQGPPVVKLDPVPEAPPVRLAPELATPPEPTVLRVAAEPVAEAKPKAKRAPSKTASSKTAQKNKPSGETA